MASWVVVPSLVSLRETFNRLAPNRDKASDGSIGDPAHASSSSDHNPDETGNVPIRDADSVNEVHAIDVDETGPWPTDARGSFTMMRAVRQLVTDHRSGAENRLRYIIYERTIWSESWGWAAREYTGANPHDKHAHFSASYTSSRERDDSPWNIGFVEDDVTPAEIDAIATKCKEKILADGGIQFLLKRVHGLVSGANPIPVGSGEENVLHRKLDELMTAVLNVDEATAERLGEADMSPDQIAAVLRPVLGDRAAAVGAALQAG